MPPPRGHPNPIEGPGDYTTTKEVHNDTYPAIDPTKADLSGRTVLITGASRGIGRSIAISFAKAGASSIIIGARSDLNKVEEDIKKAAQDAQKPLPRVLRLKLAVDDEQSVATAAKQIDETLGRVDIIVNNAGVIGERALIAQSKVDSWWETFNVNLRGPYLVVRYFLPLLEKSDSKTVITICSVGAHCVGPTLSDYQTSKLAVLRFTEFVAKECKDQGIIAFSVHPGNTLTDMLGHGEGMDENLKAVFTETPELCGDSLVYLTRERREWLSGRYINVTWDLPELTTPSKREQIVNGDMLKVRLVVP